MMLRWENPEVLPLIRHEVSQPWNVLAGWCPGDACQAWQDNSSIGIIIAVEGKERMLILWVQPPFQGLGPRIFPSSDEISALHAAYDAGMISDITFRKCTGFQVGDDASD